MKKGFRVIIPVVLIGLLLAVVTAVSVVLNTAVADNTTSVECLFEGWSGSLTEGYTCESEHRFELLGGIASHATVISDPVDDYLQITAPHWSKYEAYIINPDDGGSIIDNGTLYLGIDLYPLKNSVFTVYLGGGWNLTAFYSNITGLAKVNLQQPVTGFFQSFELPSSSVDIEFDYFDGNQSLRVNGITIADLSVANGLSSEFIIRAWGEDGDNPVPAMDVRHLKVLSYTPTPDPTPTPTPVPGAEYFIHDSFNSGSGEDIYHYSPDPFTHQWRNPDCIFCSDDVSNITVHNDKVWMTPTNNSPEDFTLRDPNFIEFTELQNGFTTEIDVQMYVDGNLWVIVNKHIVALWMEGSQLHMQLLGDKFGFAISDADAQGILKVVRESNNNIAVYWEGTRVINKKGNFNFNDQFFGFRRDGLTFMTGCGDSLSLCASFDWLTVRIP